MYMTAKFCAVFVFKQKTAYELRISDWSSDVCSSDLRIAIADAQVNLVEILVIDDRVPHGAAAARGLPLALVGPGRVALAREDVVRRRAILRLGRVGRGVEAPA